MENIKSTMLLSIKGKSTMLPLILQQNCTEFQNLHLLEEMTSKLNATYCFHAGKRDITAIFAFSRLTVSALWRLDRSSSK